MFGPKITQLDRPVSNLTIESDINDNIVDIRIAESISSFEPIADSLIERITVLSPTPETESTISIEDPYGVLKDWLVLSSQSASSADEIWANGVFASESSSEISEDQASTSMPLLPEYRALEEWLAFSLQSASPVDEIVASENSDTSTPSPFSEDQASGFMRVSPESLSPIEELLPQERRFFVGEARLLRVAPYYSPANSSLKERDCAELPVQEEAPLRGNPKKRTRGTKRKQSRLLSSRSASPVPGAVGKLLTPDVQEEINKIEDERIRKHLEAKLENPNIPDSVLYEKYNTPKFDFMMARSRLVETFPTLKPHLFGWVKN